MCSHEVSPEFREYERMVTTVVEAFLEPVCRPYLTQLAAFAPEALVMTSAGGLVPVADGARGAASLLLSGPAGGVRAAAEIAAACGFADAVSFDMGGTSTDVCLVRGRVPEPTPERVVAGLPDPAARARRAHRRRGRRFDRAPRRGRRAGRRARAAPARCPGPRATGAAVTEPTVTDADLVLGRIPADSAFPDLGRLDVGRGARARSSGRASPPRVSCASSTPRWSGRCGS